MRLLILIVDDEPGIREVLGDYLADEGYRVRTAQDGHEALAAAIAEPPDVVLSDVTMPRMNGVELIHRLRARGQDVPVVLISANYAAVDLPGVRFLTKPFDLDAITAAIEMSLADRPP